MVLAWAGISLAQQQPVSHIPLNPPALPGSTPKRNLGTSSAPSINPSLTLPNTTTWTAIGPAPLNEGGSASGRIAGLAVDPTNSSNIYIAAAGGGIWQTTNGGSTYSPLTDNQGTLSMGAIAIAPSNHLKIYAGTGEANNSLDSNYGLGILVSNDGGASWTLSTGPSGVFNRLAVSMISVDPGNANTAYAALGDYAENGLCCSHTGIYKTTDGGTTWTNVTSAAGLDSSYPWSDVAVDPNNTSIIYAAHGDIFAQNAANGVYRSTNGGSTWSLLTGAPNGSGIGRIALAIAPSASTAGQHILYVAIANNTNAGSGATLYEMLRSNNADSATPTFSNLASTPNFGGSGAQGWYDWVIAVDPANSASIYCAGALTYSNNTLNVIWSGNSGATWTDITTVNGIEPHTDSHGMAFDSTSRLLLGTDGGVWRFDPTVPSWTNLNGNLNTIQFTGIGIHPTDTQTVVGGSQDNGTELTTGSLTWNATDGGDGGYSQISQTNPLICYSNHPIGSFGATGFFRVSTDGCNTFNGATPTISNQSLFNFYAPIFVDPSNGNRVFLGGDGVYESTTAAGSWTKHTNPSGQPINSIAALAGGTTIYIATGGTLSTNSQIWVSINDGLTWSQHNLPVSGAVQEIDLDPNDSGGNTAVAVINSFNGANGQVYRTTTGGSSWSNISGSGGSALPSLPTWSAKIDTDASHTIYVSNETGVYSAPSPYGVWTAVGSGLPHAQGVSLQLNSGRHELALATHGRGAWYFSTSSSTASPTIAKAFNPTSIVTGGTSVVTLALTNSNATALTGGAFTDTLVNMSAVAGAVGGTCTGTTPATLTAGQTALSFTGIGIPASGSCTVTFSVTSSHTGGNPNSTSGVTTTQTPTAGTASNTATLTVTSLASPTIAKAFNPTSIVTGGTSVVTLTLTNSNATALTGGAFTDTLVNMSAVAGAVGGTCTGTTPATLTAGQTALSFTGIGIPASGSCTVTFSVTSSDTGGNPNSTSGVTTTQTPTAGTASNTATLTVNTAATPDLTIAKTHAGNFTQGQTGATYTITVTNSGTGPTSGTVTVTDPVPAGLTATAASGSGWTCTVTPAPVSCHRSDALAAGSSYLPITLTVTVAADAAGSVTNTATVAGGGETNTGNDTASNPTTINASGGGGGGLNENFESGAVGWTATGLWHLANNSGCVTPTLGYVSPTHAFYYGQDSTCNYATGAFAEYRNPDLALDHRHHRAIHPELQLLSGDGRNAGIRYCHRLRTRWRGADHVTDPDDQRHVLAPGDGNLAGAVRRADHPDSLHLQYCGWVLQQFQRVAD